MKQPDRKVSADVTPVESNEISTKKQSPLNRLMKNLRDSIDADQFYTAQVQEHLKDYVDEKKEGLFQRLSTYLFQYSHYSNNIKKDIESHCHSLYLYMVVYILGLVLTPGSLIYLEIGKIQAGESLLVSLAFIACYSGIMAYGINRIRQTMKQLDQLKASLSNLYIHSLAVINESEKYNIRLLHDSNYGCLHGFDDEIHQVLSLDNLLSDEYRVVKKSYTRHFLNNTNFDYINLPGIIRAHQSLYNTVIKNDIRAMGPQEGDKVLGNYELAIKKLHQIHLERLKALFEPKAYKRNKVSKVSLKTA